METKTDIYVLVGHIVADSNYALKHYKQNDFALALKMVRSVIETAEELTAFLESKKESN